MTKEELIRDLEKNVYCTIRPSPIEGVGVFAVRDIPEGEMPFRGSGDPEIVRIPESDVFDNPRIPDTVKKMVRDFYATEDGEICFSDHSFNQLDISYWMNTSSEPNVTFRPADYSVVAKRDIKAGEELTIDYGEFSDQPALVQQPEDRS